MTSHRPSRRGRIRIRLPLRRSESGRLEWVSPVHRKPVVQPVHFTPLGPDDPEVIAAFPHLSPKLQKAAQTSWKALARVLHPPGRRLVGRFVEQATVEHISVPIRGLEAGFDGYTIAFLSDIHAGPYLKADALRKLFAKVSAEKPDLIVLGGDLVNYDADEADEVAAALKQLHARDGVLSVLGNHDHYTGAVASVVSQIEHGGARYLVNDALSISRRGDHLSILGVDDGGAGRFDLARARARARETRTSILLSHTPDALPLASRLGIDLVVSGHTHGGQLRAPKFPPISTHTRGRFVDGFYRFGPTTVFVGRGVGVVCVPMRAFCPPHVPFLHLHALPRTAAGNRGRAIV